MSTMTTQKPRKLLLRRFPEQVALPSIIGMKRSRAGRSISALERHCRNPGCHQVVFLPLRREPCSTDEDDETTSGDNEITAERDRLHGTQLSLAQTKDLQQLLRGKFASWRDGVEYTATQEVNSPARKRFKTLHRETSLPRAEEEEDTEEEVIVISGPERKRAFFHLACPFYINATEKYQQCLFKNDFNSIETLISHLLRHHNRPLYCPTCRKTFETLIDRDDHALENSCKMNNQEKLEGLTESQKAKLIKKDRHYLGEVRRWRYIWSTVFPDSEQPRSPYLEDGNGLRASMVTDFWVVDGQRAVSDFLSVTDISADENSAIYKTIRHTALESLMDWVLKHDSCPTSLPSDG